MVFKYGPFGQRLRETLKKRQMTQIELANRVAVSKKSMNMYCTAGCVPQADTLAEMAHELGVSADYLLYGGVRGLEAYRDDIKAIAIMAADLEVRERNTLASLSFSLVKGTHDIKNLIADFAIVVHSLTADLNLKKLGVWEQRKKEMLKKHKDKFEKE